MDKKTKIGILTISGKPIHCAHQYIINFASKENDRVILYVSLSDRKRNGEITIYGEDMEKIWKDYLCDIMPPNVSITYGGSPIRQAYSMLGEESKSNSNKLYTIYGDPNDLAKNFSEKSLEKYAKNLYNNGLIRLHPLPRNETVNISGTQMREFLKNGQKDLFLKYLPRGIDKEAIWEILQKRLWV